MVVESGDDTWFDWLLRTRHGADAAYAHELQRMIDDIRDRVLDQARLRPGGHVADIGSGDGLVGLEVLRRDPTAFVTFVDISPALVAHTRALAGRCGFLQRCRFVVASAQALGSIADDSVDVVTVRAVLAYLSDKIATLRELCRILQPDGRISIVDPIFQDRALTLAAIANQLRTGKAGAATRYFTFLHRCVSAQLPDTLDGIAANPLTNYTERDLVRFFELAGFVNVHLRLHIDCIDALPMPWPAYLASSPYAGAPTVAEILETRFDRAEQIEFEQLFRGRVETGAIAGRTVNAYVFADKSAAVAYGRSP